MQLVVGRVGIIMLLWCIARSSEKENIPKLEKIAEKLRKQLRERLGSKDVCEMQEKGKYIA